MASLNRVCLIGIVVRPPRACDDGVRLMVGVAESDGRRLQQIAVTLHGGLPSIADGVRTGQALYVDGRLGRLPDGRPLVEAAVVFAIGDRPPPPQHGVATGMTHASPRPHTRAGHARRIHIATPRERVVWVRPCHVGIVATAP